MKKTKQGGLPLRKERRGNAAKKKISTLRTNPQEQKIQSAAKIRGTLPKKKKEGGGITGPIH